MLRSIAASAAVIGLCAIVAACGDDSEQSSASATSTLQSSASPTSAPPTGEPIRLGLITRALYMPLGPPGAQAAIEAINANGGVNGRPLELVTCSNEDKAATAAVCAQQFAGDPTIIATVGDVSAYGADTNPPLELAKVAGVGMQASGAGDFASPRVFPNSSGSLSLLGAAAYAYDGLGGGDIGFATIDSPTAQALPALIDANVLKSRGTALAATALVPSAAADVSSQAATLVDSDVVVLSLTADLAIRMIKSLRQQGYSGPIVVPESGVDGPLVEESLSATESKDLYSVSYYDKTSDGYKRYLADMEKYESDTAVAELGAVAWLGVNIFAHVASELPSVSREAVYDAMGKLTGYDTGGMLPGPLGYTTPGTALGGKAPRLFDSVMFVYANEYEDGEFVPVEAEPKAIPVFS